MTPRRPAPLAALAVAFLGGALLLAACAPRTSVDAPPPPAEAPVVLVTAAPSAAPAAPPPPPTGPGTIACGATRCRAGAELCCLGEPARCVPAPALPPGGDEYQEAAAREKACGARRFLACDDAGDCGAGQTCCEEQFEFDTVSLYQGACRPLRAGRVTCPRAELCSADDGRCARKDNACAGEGDTRRCALPLALRTRPRCGKKPCAAGMTCVVEDAGPTCVPGVFRNDFGDRTDVLECERGRDCGEDESCYQNPRSPGQRCDFSVAGLDGLVEPAYCTGPEDCVAACRLAAGTVPSCYTKAKQRLGHCECLTPCTQDADCEGCGRLAMERNGDFPDSSAYCDRKKGGCECRVKKP